MSVLFVRSGGGAPGLDIHAGIMMALDEAGIKSTANIGTSAGAIISAMDSFGYSGEKIAGIVRGLEDSDFRDEVRLWKLRMLWVTHWLKHKPIDKILATWLPGEWERLRKRLRVVATDVNTGREKVFSWKDRDWIDLRQAVLASMSISGVFPWVQTQCGTYADGGTVANLPLPRDWKSFDEVWLLIATRGYRYPKKNRGIISRLLLNIDWYAADQLFDVFHAVKGAKNVYVVWPTVGSASGALRFNHELIEMAYVTALDQIKAILKNRNVSPETNGCEVRGTGPCLN